MNETKKKKLRTFPGLDAKDFQHPWDATATEALKSIPGLNLIIAKIMEYGLERVFYLHNTASNVRVTARQFSRLHRALSWGCKIIGVEEPEMYVELDPTPNAYTYGHTRPFIVLTSGLVDMLDDEERFFIIAHELGHIKAGHVLYTIIARNSTLNKAYKALLTAYRTHPFPILRAKELDEWHSGGYRTLAGPLGLLKS